MRIALAILLFAATAENGAPVLSVNPRVLLAGHAVHLICKVPRHADNRQVDIGVENWSYTSRELRGEDSPITFDLPVLEHAPCDAGPAFCVITRAGGRQLRAETHLEVAGCD